MCAVVTRCWSSYEVIREPIKFSSSWFIDEWALEICIVRNKQNCSHVPAREGRRSHDYENDQQHLKIVRAMSTMSAKRFSSSIFLRLKYEYLLAHCSCRFRVAGKKKRKNTPREPGASPLSNLLICAAGWCATAAWSSLLKPAKRRVELMMKLSTNVVRNQLYHPLSCGYFGSIRHAYNSKASWATKGETF
jgi:hypothetical protein